MVSYFLKQLLNKDKKRDILPLFKPSKDEIKSLPGDTEVSFVPMATLNTFDAFSPITVSHHAWFAEMKEFIAQNLKTRGHNYFVFLF